MTAFFRGVQWVVPTDLGISQLYLNGSKLKNIQKWFDPNNMNLCAPLPVHDFGDGRLTLTDGHSRAFLAYRHKTRVPIIYDGDDIVTGDEGQLLYKNSIVWCRRLNLQTVADLENRIVDDSSYQSLWVDRCKLAYNLLTRTNDDERAGIQRRCPDWFLYGANEELTICYFEKPNGKTVEVDL
ncbi:hypothetical protein [uncultured Subdoligranulum sp.]|uniref:hypothetical protein n=1 Tax=uncultured Subdoligranulum sp. TaxID=512298 RepID=UPI0025EB625F|nr:hypothetical protein [uncultured Subdoligranulum sp.]